MLNRLWNLLFPKKSPLKKRIYEGARQGRLTSDWIASGTSADSEIYTSLRSLRHRSRSLARDNDYARCALRTILNNTIGKGIGLQAQIETAIFEVSDDRKNSQLEAAWLNWQKSKYCHTAGKLSFVDLQRLVLRSVAESGEVFIRLVGSSFGGSAVPFAIEIIESDLVCDDYNGTSALGNEIRMGIEVDTWGRAIAYWMYDRHPGDYQFLSSHAHSRLKRIPASEILHIFLTERPNQTRGVPWFYSAITRFRHIGGYEEAEIVAARASASVMGFLQNADADLGETDQYGSPIDSLEAGTIKKLAPGEVFEGFNPSRPNAGFEGFMRSVLRGIAAGIGMSYESLSKDFSQSNYSSSRLSLLEDRDNWQTLQVWFIDAFLQPVYEAWLEMAVMGGVLNFADYELRPERYEKPRWCPRGWSWVDPNKEINATIAAIDNGLSTLTYEIAKQGGDLEETLKMRAKELKLAKSLGLDLKSEIGIIDQEKSFKFVTFNGKN